MLPKMARETGLEPATSGVTGRRSNQLSYSRVTRMCPRGTMGDLKGGHGEVKDVALTGSKRLFERGGTVSLRSGRLPRDAESINMLQAPQAISGDIWLDRRLARLRPLQRLAKSKRPPQGGHFVSNRTFFQ